MNRREPDEVTSHPDLTIRVWRAGQQVEPDRRVTGRVKPVEFHLKEDGALDNRPSLAIVLVTGQGDAVVGEISLAMLEPVLQMLDRYRAAPGPYL